MVSAFELYVGVFKHRRFLTERRNQRFFDPWITHLHDVKILAVAFCSLLSCNIALLSWHWSTKSEYSRIYPQSHWYSGLRWVEYAPLFRSSLGYCSDQTPDPGRPFQMRQASDCKRWPGRHSHRCFWWLLRLVLWSLNFLQTFLEDCWMNLVLLFLSSDVFFPPILDVPFFFCFQKSLIFYYIYI